MVRFLRRAGLCIALCAWSWPAHALDPMLMFLLSAAREIIAAAAREHANAPVTPVPVPPERYPGTVVEPRELRRLIDECFGYLSDGQRQEIFDSLHARLMDPKNAAVRGAMIDYFVTRAVAVREAQQRLAHLSDPERKRLVEEFKDAVAEMPSAEVQQLAELLRKGVLPVPGDLNAQLLAALDER
jgi:hypothetical protein